MATNIVSPLDVPFPLLKDALGPPLTPGVTSLSDGTWRGLGMGEGDEIDEDESPEDVLGELLGKILKIGESDPMLLNIVIETATAVRDTLQARNDMGLDDSLLSLPTPVSDQPSLLNEEGPDIGAGALGLSMMSPPPLTF